MERSPTLVGLAMNSWLSRVPRKRLTFELPTATKCRTIQNSMPTSAYYMFGDQRFLLPWNDSASSMRSAERTHSRSSSFPHRHRRRESAVISRMRCLKRTMDLSDTLIVAREPRNTKPRYSTSLLGTMRLFSRFTTK